MSKRVDSYFKTPRRMVGNQAQWTHDIPRYEQRWKSDGDCNVSYLGYVWDDSFLGFYSSLVL